MSKCICIKKFIFNNDIKSNHYYLNFVSNNPDCKDGIYIGKIFNYKHFKTQLGTKLVNIDTGSFEAAFRLKEFNKHFTDISKHRSKQLDKLI